MQPNQPSQEEKENHEEDNPALSKIIEQNIRTIIGLLTEHELTRVLQMLDAVQDKLGIVDHANSDLADLEMETKPEDALAEIHRLQAIELNRG
jgi:hypothetical protein